MISVIVPCRNEEEHIVDNIKEIISTLTKLGHEHEIIIVDDCSNDDTYLVSAMELKTEHNVRIFRKVMQQGKGSAIKTGWKFALGDYVAVMDADLQILPAEIETFFKIMNLYGADVVVGNKRHSYSNTDYTFLRKIVSAGYRFLVFALFGLRLRDTQCGFKLFTKEAMDLVMHKILCKQFAFDLELIVALRENNVRIADAPVTVRKSLGRGSVSRKTILDTAQNTLAIWWRKQKKWYR